VFMCGAPLVLSVSVVGVGSGAGVQQLKVPVWADSFVQP
jgi:hypothetical protein